MMPKLPNEENAKTKMTEYKKQNATNGWLYGMGRLKPGIAADAAGAELAVLATTFAHSINPASQARRISDPHARLLELRDLVRAQIARTSAA